MIKQDTTQRELLIRIDERQKIVLAHLIEVETHLKELNGNVNRNKANIQKVVYAIMLGSVIWIKESRDFMIGFLGSIIGL